jgi:hypothetical protein
MIDIDLFARAFGEVVSIQAAATRAFAHVGVYEG